MSSEAIRVEVDAALYGARGWRLSLVRDGEPLGMCGSVLDVRQFARALLPVDLASEVFVVISVNARNEVIGWHRASHGVLTASLVHPREVFAPALMLCAAAVIVVHNHPSGDPTPSEADHAVTKRLQKSGALLGVALLDHVVIGSAGRYYSYRESGALGVVAVAGVDDDGPHAEVLS